MTTLNVLNKRLVRKLVSELYTEDIESIQKVANAETNTVYYVKTFSKESNVIVRISQDQTKINDYLKEQWCIKTAKEVGVPVPEILEVSNRIVPYPYCVVKYKKGTPGNQWSGDRGAFYLEMGETLKKIHTIKTKGFGNTFDWSHNQLSKYNSWDDYLTLHYRINEVIKFLRATKLLKPSVTKRITEITADFRTWNFKPVLCHNDFLVKNILLNTSNHISTVLDWELAVSSHKYRDLGKTIRNLLWRGDYELIPYLIKGYGMRPSEYERYKHYMLIFDLYAEVESEFIPRFPKNVTKERVDEFVSFWNTFFQS
jgi:aminoglycoside phosphotransferase (APT) family kinase protein